MPPLPSIDRRRLQRHARDLRASLCRDSIADFVRELWSVLEPNGRPYVPNVAADAILLHLQAIGEGRIAELGIACPPGIGKSTFASIAFPAWLWARDPSFRFVCASHTHSLATNLARKFLRVVTSDLYRSLFPHVVLESDAIERITTTASGSRHAFGTEAAVTGFRADIGIIDDSLSARDAENKNVVASINEWFDVVFSNRLDQRRRAMLVIQQRLGENDLIAHARELGAEILELPARFESNRRCSTSLWTDPRKRDGDILAPEIQSDEFLDKMLRTLRPHGFAGQYQQRPAPREGGQFKVGGWAYCALKEQAVQPVRPLNARVEPAYVIPRRHDGALDLDWLCVSVDATGGSTADNASAVGLLTIGGKGQRRFVLEDRTPGPRTFLQTIGDVRAAIVSAVNLAGRQPKLIVLVEKKALGQAAIEKLTQAIRDGDLRDGDGAPIVASVVAFEPAGRGDKEQRAIVLEPDVDAGLWHVMDGAPWVAAFIEEFALFPRGARDDRVDAASQVAVHFAKATDAKARWKGASKLGIFRPH